MTRPLVCLFLFLAIFYAGTAYPQPKVYIDINAPGFRSFPLAIAEFKNLGLDQDSLQITKKLSQVLSNDLEMSGLFRLVDPVLFLEDPRKAGLTVKEIDFRDWSAIGVEGLVKGGIYIRGQELKTEFRLFDVFQQTQIVGVRYSGNLEDWRRMAHKFANEVIARLTGEEGVFDTRIAFVADVGKAKEIFVADYDGHNLKGITKNGSLNLSPSWDPTGDRILFTSYISGNPDLYLTSVYGGTPTRVARWDGLNLGGQWSPATNRIALTLTKDGNPEIYTMNPDGSGLKRLSNHYGVDVSPVWSPDGKQLAFVSDRAGSPQIYIMSADGSGARRLTFEGRYNASPAWSPRGDKIAFSGTADGSFNIFIINTDGSGLTRLTHGDADDLNPSFSPDGRYIIYSSKRAGKSRLYIVSIFGGNARRIEVPVENAMRPVWSPRLK